MTLRIPNDSAIDGILFNRHLNYFIPTSQSQQGIFDMAYFSGQRTVGGTSDLASQDLSTPITSLQLYL